MVRSGRQGRGGTIAWTGRRSYTCPGQLGPSTLTGQRLGRASRAAAEAGAPGGFAFACRRHAGEWASQPGRGSAPGSTGPVLHPRQGAGGQSATPLFWGLRWCWP